MRALETRATPWASALFLGARHRVTLHGTAGPALDGWIAMLAERDLPMRGHLVADLRVAARRTADDREEIVLEALTVVDR